MGVKRCAGAHLVTRVFPHPPTHPTPLHPTSTSPPQEPPPSTYLGLCVRGTPKEHVHNGKHDNHVAVQIAEGNGFVAHRGDSHPTVLGPQALDQILAMPGQNKLREEY